MEPNNESGRIKAYLDDPQYLSISKTLDRKINKEANLSKYIIIRGTFLVNYSCS